MQRSESAIGKIIDGYKILDLLGQGGMGIVYKAEDVALSRIVALKMIAPDLASQDSFLRRFQSEARALARVHSPFIVGIHTLRKSGNHVFIVMEYVDGWTLSDEMNKGLLETRRAFSILRQLLQAFSHAHGVGVVHRDIKPSNIMLTREGRVKVTDFGLAKLRREDGMSTVTQGIAGTARYMSPEQVQGKKIDHRSDIYSLGMTLYHMFAGKLPFEPDEGTYSILRRVVEEDFPQVSELNGSISPALSEIISRALAKDPDDRFQSADAMLAAVDAVIQQAETRSTERVSVRPQAAKRTRGKRLMYSLLTLCALLVFPIYYFVSGSGESNSSVEAGESEQAVEMAADTMRRETDQTIALLSITSSPSGAQVFASGQSIGVTPLIDHLLVPGAVELRLAKEGYLKMDRVVELATGSTDLHFDLQREAPPIAAVDPLPISGGREPVVPTVMMRLNAEPSGAIYVNGERMGNPVERMWPTGEYVLRFEATGQPEMACETTITISVDNPVDLTCYFDHKLTINTASRGGGVAPYANIFLNGVSHDATPLASYPVSSGTYTVELRRFGFIIEDPTRTLVFTPTFDVEETNHKETFYIRAE